MQGAPDDVVFMLFEVSTDEAARGGQVAEGTRFQAAEDTVNELGRESDELPSPQHTAD